MFDKVEMFCSDFICINICLKVVFIVSGSPNSLHVLLVLISTSEALNKLTVVLF